MTTHPYDPGRYSVLLFTPHNRKRGRLLVSNYQRSTEAAARWKRRTGGSAVVLRCLFNTALGRGAYSEKWQ